MVIDPSAILAILLEEADASVYASAMADSPTCLISAASLVEASLIALRLRAPDPIAALDTLIDALAIEVIPVDRDQAMLAREAFRRFGKGRHKAALNFGDCFSYALAKHTGQPLLFKGDDFRQTDIPAA
jgi:ribonuclease VapC